MKMLVIVMIVVVIGLSVAAWCQNQPDNGAAAQPRWQRGDRSGGAAGAWRTASGCASIALRLPQSEMLDRVAEPLKLTDEQKKKLTDALKAAETKLEPLRQKCTDAVDALRKALYASQTEAAALRDLVDKAQKAEAAVASAQLDAWTEIRGILTSEQLTKLGDTFSRQGRNRQRPQ